MSKYQVAWTAATGVALVQYFEDTIPPGSVNIGTYEHASDADPLEYDVNHVLWHHVRDLLYKIGVQDMQRIKIQIDESIDVAGVNLVPANFGVKMGQTFQLAVEFVPPTALNKKVSFASSNPAVLTVSPTGLVTPVANGIANVTVTTEEGHFQDTSVGTVTTAVTGVTLAPTSATVAVGNTLQLVPTVLPNTASNKAVSYMSSDPTVATVSASGLVTPLKNGNVTITVRTTDGEFFASTAITVITNVASVSVNPTTRNLNAGASFQLDVTVLPATASNKAVTYASSNNAVATVTSGGLVTGVTNGTATITVTTVDQGKTATSAITVAVRAAGVTLTPDNVTVNKGSVTQITPVFAPSNTANQGMSYVSSDESIATVQSNGQVTGVAKGTVTITGTTADGGFTDTMQVTVNVPVAFITMSQATLALNVGFTSDLNVVVSPADATDTFVSWSTSNPAVATVNADGLVSALNPGSATITATSRDGAKTATCVTTVSQPAEGLNVSPTAMTLTVGSTSQITPTVIPSDASNKAVTYQSYDAGIASVNSAGLVTAVAPGTAGIQVQTVDGGHTQVVNVTVNKIPVTSVTGSPKDQSVAVGSTLQLSAAVLPANATYKTVSWTSGNPEFATVNSAGLVTAVAPGYATITATADGIQDYIGVSVVAAP